jgi:hypothetical protein
LLALLGVFIFLVSFQKQHWDSDIFWALKSGEWIVTNFSVPLTDPFSYTFADKEWIDFTWGFQVIAYSFYTYLGGWVGLFILQFTLLLATFYIFYRNLIVITKGRQWMAVAFLYIVFAMTYQRFFIRPHLFAYLFISLYFYILNSSEENTSLKRLLWLLPLQLLWANIHSSSILGIFIVGSYAIGAFVGELRGRGLRLLSMSSSFKAIAAVSILVLAFSFINPYGWKLVLFPFVHQGGVNSDALRHISEWSPMNLRSLFYFLPVPLGYFIFKVVLYGTFVAFIFNLRRVKVRDLILFFPLLYMAISHIRWVSVFGLFAVTVAALNIASSMRGSSRSSSILKPVAAIFIVLISVLFLYSYSTSGYKSHFGLGLRAMVFPEGTVRFIKDQGVRGTIYNQYVYGGYLLYHDAENKIFMDSRVPTLYSAYFFWTERQVRQSASKWQRLVDDRGIDMALVKPTIGFCDRLWKSDEWVAVNYDDVSVLFLKDVASHKEIISRWGMTSLSPCDRQFSEDLSEDKAELMTMRREAKRVLGYFKKVGMTDRFARPASMLARIDVKLGPEYYGEAEEQLKHAIDVFPQYTFYYDMALVLGKMERYDEALKYYKKASSGLMKAYISIGLIYYDMGEYKESMKALKKYVVMADDYADSTAFEPLGMACLQLGDLGCAVHYLKRAAFSTDAPQALGRLYYNIGNAYFGQGDLEAGLVAFRKAIALDSIYKGKLRELSEVFDSRGWTGKVEALKGLIIVI